ncbi:MAG: hypothetical protein SH847_16370 [Roseiflexaceae bacterium]|nr:hypothetical protein [Roseiflexaceae bacterium]
MDRKYWCWELQQHGYGPDWRFCASIHPVGPLLFEHLAQQYIPQELFHYSEDDMYCADHQQLCHQHVYIDDHSFQKLEHMKEKQENIWIYHQISIHQNLLMIERGYAGWQDPYNQAETMLLLDLFARPEIELEQWRIIAYGDGYESKIVRVGTSLADLQSYLA